MLVLILSVLFIIFFILNATSAIPETAEAFKLFLFVVLPSIFPLCVISDWLVRTDAFYKPGQKLSPLMNPLFGISGVGALAVLTGWIGSYPTGAKTTAALYKSGQLTYRDAVTLTAFTNNAGPLFVIGVVGTTMLSSSLLGVILWFCHVSAAFLTGLLLRGKNTPPTKTPSSAEISTNMTATELYPTHKKPFQLLSHSIADAARTMVPVGGTVIFFAAVCASIQNSNSSILQTFSGILRMLLEMTSGCQAISSFVFSNISNAYSLLLKACLFAAVISWGGISVHLQVIYILSENGLPCGKYLLGKAIHTLLSVLLTFCGVIAFLNL